MDRLSMRINPKLKNELLKYNINLPVDRRTTAYKDIVKRFGTPELYKIHLQSKVGIAKVLQKTEDNKIKQQERKEQKNKEQRRLRCDSKFYDYVALRTASTTSKHRLHPYENLKRDVGKEI